MKSLLLFISWVENIYSNQIKGGEKMFSMAPISQTLVWNESIVARRSEIKDFLFNSNKSSQTVFDMVLDMACKFWSYSIMYLNSNPLQN